MSILRERLHSRWKECQGCVVMLYKKASGDTDIESWNSASHEAKHHRLQLEKKNFEGVLQEIKKVLQSKDLHQTIFKIWSSHKRS